VEARIASTGKLGGANPVYTGSTWTPDSDPKGGEVRLARQFLAKGQAREKARLEAVVVAPKYTPAFEKPTTPPPSPPPAWSPPLLETPRPVTPPTPPTEYPVPKPPAPVVPLLGSASLIAPPGPAPVIVTLGGERLTHNASPSPSGVWPLHRLPNFKPPDWHVVPTIPTPRSAHDRLSLRELKAKAREGVMWEVEEVGNIYYDDPISGLTLTLTLTLTLIGWEYIFG